MLQGTRVEGVITKLFAGQMLNYIDCIHVDYKSQRKELFMDLQVGGWVGWQVGGVGRCAGVVGCVHGLGGPGVGTRGGWGRASARPRLPPPLPTRTPPPPHFPCHPFLALAQQLDVKGCRTIYDSFNKYTEQEVLDGENQYDAEEHGKQVGGELRCVCMCMRVRGCVVLDGESQYGAEEHGKQVGGELRCVCMCMRVRGCVVLDGESQYGAEEHGKQVGGGPLCARVRVCVSERGGRCLCLCVVCSPACPRARTRRALPSAPPRTHARALPRPLPPPLRRTPRRACCLQSCHRC